MPGPDPFDLERFVAAQAATFAAARAELAAGAKCRHWMWFIFPQLVGLGSSPMAMRFGLSGMAEAQAYLAHPLLGPRLLDCTALVLGHADRPLPAILPPPDDMKFRSSMTLFAAAAPATPVFREAIDRACGGLACAQTLRRLG